MNTKIRNYVEVLFSDIPKTKKAIELKEEILGNLSDRFDDYIKEGKSETQAYSLAVSTMGEIDELLDSVKPDANFVNDANKHRKAKARNTAIAVVIYILGLISFLTLVGVGELLGALEDFMSIIGLISMFSLAAIATAILIYTNMSMPAEFKDYNREEEREYRKNESRSEKIFKSIMSVYWSVVLLIYLAISFFGGNWGISWIIWPLAGILSSIIKTIFEIGETNE